MCNRLSDYKSGWSKEPQWKNDCGSFLQCFVLVHTQVYMLDQLRNNLIQLAIVNHVELLLSFGKS
jgi:hypothetical protein